MIANSMEVRVGERFLQELPYRSDKIHRRVLLCSSHIPSRVSTSTAKDDIQDAHIPSKWYVAAAYEHLA